MARRFLSWQLGTHPKVLKEGVYPCLLGGVIGVAAWGPGRTPLVLVVLPLLIAMATSRRHAFLIAFAYGFATHRETLQAIADVAPWDMPAALAAWSVATVVAGMAWSLYWTRSSQPGRKALACLVGWLAVMLSPAGDLALGSSVVGWGYLAPGYGWGGVLFSAVVPALAMYQVAKDGESRQKTWIWVSVLGVLLAVQSLTPRAIETRYVQDIVGVSTRWQPSAPVQFLAQHLQSVAHTADQLAAEKLATVMVYPAGVVLAASGDDLLPLKTALANVARKAGMVIVLGIDIAQEGRANERSALAFFPDGRSEMAKGHVLENPFGMFLPATMGLTMHLREGLDAQLVLGNQHAFALAMLVDEGLVYAPLVFAMLDAHSEGVVQTHIQGMALLFSQKLVVSGIETTGMKVALGGAAR
jgi:hypothetical protein